MKKRTPEEEVEHSRDFRERRLRKGLCIACGKDPVTFSVTGKRKIVRCTKCNNQQANNYKRRTK